MPPQRLGMMAAPHIATGSSRNQGISHWGSGCASGFFPEDCSGLAPAEILTCLGTAAAMKSIPTPWVRQGMRGRAGPSQDRPELWHRHSLLGHEMASGPSAASADLILFAHTLAHTAGRDGRTGRSCPTAYAMFARRILHREALAHLVSSPSHRRLLAPQVLCGMRERGAAPASLLWRAGGQQRGEKWDPYTLAMAGPPATSFI